MRSATPGGRSPRRARRPPARRRAREALALRGPRPQDRQRRTGTDTPRTSLEATLEEILSNVRRLLPIDAAAFLVVDWDSELITPAASWFSSQEIEAALGPILTRRYDRERPGITEGAIEQGRPLLLRNVDRWPGARSLRARLERDLDPEQAERTWRWYRQASVMSCPVQTSDGRALGVLALSATPPLPPLEEEALGTVAIFANLAAVAIDRAELLDAEGRRRRREAALSRAGQAIAESLDPAAVHARIVEQAIVLTGATKALLTHYVAPLGQLEVVASSGFSDEVASARFRLGEGMIGTVAADRVPYRSRPEDSDRFLRWVLEREGIASFAHVPIELGPRLFGVVSVAHEQEGFFGDGELGELVKFARLAAAAIANAADYQHEQRLVRALARGFAPARPERLPGFDLGIRYEPAGAQSSGGDVYGAWMAGEQRAAVLIGDVSGKGLEVAAPAAMVRFYVDARGLDCSSPAQILADTDALLRARLTGDGFVTVFFGFLAGDELRYCNAGHLAPLLIAADGELRELDSGGLPLGIQDGVERRTTTARLGPGDMLLAFTDGLSEARRGDELFGASELRQALAELRSAESCQQLVDALYERALGWAGELRDDVAILALRRR
jgi:serine phosphatase RsbU (regulator of sigma subunit)